MDSPQAERAHHQADSVSVTDATTPIRLGNIFFFFFMSQMQMSDSEVFRQCGLAIFTVLGNSLNWLHQDKQNACLVGFGRLKGPVCNI